MKHNPLPCGHKFMPPAIQEIFGEDIESVFCPTCHKWMDWIATRQEKTGENESPLSAF